MFAKATKIALTLIGTFTLGIPSAIAAINIGVNPPRMELEIGGKTRTQTIRVINLSSQPVELKAYVRSWRMSENNRLEEIPSGEESLARWIVFTPSQFTIPPRSSQTIRFNVRPRTKPKSGEHRAIMYLEELPSAAEKASGIKTVARLGVVIYGYVGDIKRVGVLNSITVDTKTQTQPTAVFDVSSQGNGYVRLTGQYSIWPAAKYPGAKTTKPIDGLGRPGKKIPENILDAGMLPNSPVLPAERRRLLLPISKKLPPGNYVLDLNGELNGIKIDQGIPFTISAPTTQKSQTQPNTSRNLKNPLGSR